MVDYQPIGIWHNLTIQEFNRTPPPIYMIGSTIPVQTFPFTSEIYVKSDVIFQTDFEAKIFSPDTEIAFVDFDTEKAYLIKDAVNFSVFESVQGVTTRLSVQCLTPPVEDNLWVRKYKLRTFL